MKISYVSPKGTGNPGKWLVTRGSALIDQYEGDLAEERAVHMAKYLLRPGEELTIENRPYGARKSGEATSS